MPLIKEFRHYTVRYKKTDGTRQILCVYATDAWEARILAMEKNGYIRMRPNSIDNILEHS